MNPTLTTLFNHRSIRQFTAEKLTTDEVTTLIAAHQHAATSTFSQQYSIISVTDPAKLTVLGDITGHHWLEQAGHYFVMVADQYRNQQMVPPTATTTTNLHSLDKLLAGVFDAAIATEAIVTAGESLNLGSTIMGSILNDDAPRVTDLLDLPELTFPVLGLAIGHPTEHPEQKPRLPQDLMHFTNGYQALTADDARLVAYDQVIHDYYQQRGLTSAMKRLVTIS
ncbi:nitroreductase family protein [Levilactobacillus brevis]|nr:nitroreductase family protein [Levilactobacillus brevis]